MKKVKRGNVTLKLWDIGGCAQLMADRMRLNISCGQTSSVPVNVATIRQRRQRDSVSDIARLQ